MLRLFRLARRHPTELVDGFGLFLAAVWFAGAPILVARG